MPGALKLTNLTILHAHKPFKLFTNFSSPTSPAAAVTATVDSRTIPPLRSLAGWWCRITPFEPPVHVNYASNCFHRRNYGHNFCLYTTASRSKGENGNFHRDTNNNFGTQMGAIVNGRVEDEQNKSDASPTERHGGKPPVKPSKLLTLPTILTIGRVAAIPFLVYTFYVESWWGPAATVGIFIAAATTDWLDGYLARKMKLGTPFGAFLDPVADKLMVATTLILLCTKPLEAGMFGQAPWLLAVPAAAIICREITISAVREWAASQEKKLLEVQISNHILCNYISIYLAFISVVALLQAVAVNNLGKWKTATQMSALTILLAARDGSLVGAETLVSSGVVLLYVSAWLSLWSLFVYMRKIWRVMMM